MSVAAGVSLLREGAGKDLVFLHGYLSCKESFYHQINCLKKFYRVTAFDFWGMGKSEPLSQAWSVGDYAEHTSELLKKLGIRDAYLIAHSFGGRVALKLLSKPDPPFQRALLTGCAGLLPRRGIRYALRVKSYRVMRKIAPKFAERKFGSDEYRSLSPVMRESYKKIVNEDLRAAAATIGVPVCLIYGREDGVTPACEEGLTFASLMRRSRLEIMEGGHFCFSENHAEFNSKVLAFIFEGEREQVWEYSYPSEGR